MKYRIAEVEAGLYMPQYFDKDTMLWRPASEVAFPAISRAREEAQRFENTRKKELAYKERVASGKDISEEFEL